MKKINFFIMALMIILMIPAGVALASASPVDQPQAVPTPNPAQLPTPFPEIKTFEQTAKFTFADLGEEQFVMRYPSFRDIYFPLPNSWRLVGGDGYSYIELRYDFFESTTQEQTVPTPHPLFERYPFIARPGVEIYLNNVLIYVFVPEVGRDRTVQIPIPKASIPPIGENPFNEFNLRIGFFNDADIYCNYDGILTIHPISSVNAVFGQQPPFRRLSDLPRPLVSDSFMPETLKVVVPDNPNATELEVVGFLSASIARNSFSNVNFDVLTASQATDAELENNNVLVVGSPERNSFLRSLYQKQVLPTGLAGDGRNILQSGANNIDEGWGVLQIAPSDLNQFMTYVVVTGESDDALQRAARAFDNPPIGVNPFLLIATEEMYPARMAIANAPAIPQTTFTLEELGFRDRTSFGLGANRFLVFFYVPRNWVLEEDLALTVNYSYSDAIDAHSSNIVVNLNNQPIGNLMLEETVAEQKTAVITIKRENVLQGMVNVIDIRAILAATLVCEDYNPDVYWFRIFNNGSLEIPHRLATSAAEIAPIIHPTIPFAYEGSHLVALGPNPSRELMSAYANLYWQLGDFNQQGSFDILVSLDQQVDPAQFPNRNVLMLGLPTSTNLVDQLNERLPQPFIAGSSNLQQVIAEQPYQLVPGLSVGLVQSVPASWDYARTITMVTGTTEEGVRWSFGQLRRDVFQFAGDLFFAQEFSLAAFRSTLFSQPVLDAMVSDALGEQELVPAEEPAAEENQEAQAGLLTGNFIRNERINDTTTPVFIMALIAVVGLIFIVYLAARITSGRRR